MLFPIWQDLSVFVSDVTSLSPRLAGFVRVFPVRRGSPDPPKSATESLRIWQPVAVGGTWWQSAPAWTSFGFGAAQDSNLYQVAIPLSRSVSGWQDLAAFVTVLASSLGKGIRHLAGGGSRFAFDIGSDRPDHHHRLT
jgi:hypothetical protein